MPVTIKYLQPEPEYVPELTIGPLQVGTKLVFTIDAAGPATFQLARINKAGDAEWDNQEYTLAGFSGIVSNVQGVRFKQGDDTFIPRINATLLLIDDADFLALSSFPASFTADGAVETGAIFFDTDPQQGSFLTIGTDGDMNLAAGGFPNPGGGDFNLGSGNDINQLAENDINLLAEEDISLRTNTRDINVLAANDLNLFATGGRLSIGVPEMAGEGPSALPATPDGYVYVTMGGVQFRVPVYV